MSQTLACALEPLLASRVEHWRRRAAQLYSAAWAGATGVRRIELEAAYAHAQAEAAEGTASAASLVWQRFCHEIEVAEEALNASAVAPQS